MVEKSKNRTTTIITMVIILLITLFFYLPVTQSFFQQDEWLAFGNVYGGAKILEFSPQHFVPLFNILFNFLFKLIGLNYFAWASVSIIFHLAIVILVYWVAKEITENKFIA